MTRRTRFHHEQQVKRTAFAHFLVQLWHGFLKPQREESKSSQLDNEAQAEFVWGRFIVRDAHFTSLGKAKLLLLHITTSENLWLFQPSYRPWWESVHWPDHYNRCKNEKIKSKAIDHSTVMKLPIQSIFIISKQAREPQRILLWFDTFHLHTKGSFCTSHFKKTLQK